MKDTHNLPKCHLRIKAVKKHIEDETIKQCFNRYTYRYRVARAFEGINAPDIEKRTRGGYEVAIKLLLAYSAYEEIRAIKFKVKELKLPRGEHIKIFNNELANKLREITELEKLLKNSRVVYDKNLVLDMNNFYENRNDDVLCIATAFRNTFAHGVFTAGAADLTSKKHQKIIINLIESILLKSEEIANECAEYFERNLKG